MGRIKIIGYKVFPLLFNADTLSPVTFSRHMAEYGHWG